MKPKGYSNEHARNAGQMAKSNGPSKTVKRRSPYSHYNRTVYSGLGTGSFGLGYGYGGGYYNRYMKSPEYQKRYGSKDPLQERKCKWIFKLGDYFWVYRKTVWGFILQFVYFV